MICNIVHDGNTHIFLNKANIFLNAAEKVEEMEAIRGQFRFCGKSGLVLPIRLGVPKIPGLDTT